MIAPHLQAYPLNLDIDRFMIPCCYQYKWSYLKGPVICATYVRIMQKPQVPVPEVWKYDYKNKVEKTFVSKPLNVINPCRICFSETKNCAGILLTKIFNCIASLN